ncbi:response regulator [Alteromonas pelagimontana]|uniref:Response regulator n=2 Tax=Alteromonas pelagimontana TaxID=1858656 RepID=A0A6M4ML34_9ALTE|nr:response regulator [Alteromonas pelagimontana]
MQLKTLLVDDELSAIEGLAIRLDAFAEIDIIGHATSVDEAIDIINREPPDLIFLDIEMPGKTGFDLIKQLQPERCPAIIFITAFHQHAVKAFEVRAIDYLLKPVKTERLSEALARVMENQKNPVQKHQMMEVRDELVQTEFPNKLAKAAPQYRLEQEKLVIQDGKNPVQLVPYNHIIWIDAAGDYMCVHTRDETYVMRARMKSLVKERLPDDFVRIHKSTIVNLNHIRQLEPLRNSEYFAILNNGKSLKVSRTYSRNLKARLMG